MHSGVVTRTELLGSGETDSSIRRAIRNGDLQRVRPGWFATPSADPAVVEAVRRGGCLSCVSALRSHGLWVPPGYDSVHVRTSRYAMERGSTTCHAPGRPRPVTTAVDTIPLALACAARCMSAEDWIVVCDSALGRQNWSTDELRHRMGTVSASMDALLRKCDGRSQSGTETLARVRFRAAGFRVEVQPAIPGVGWVDLKIGRLLFECDSKPHHTSLENYRNDRRRDRCALVDGWMTMRVTYDDVMYGWEHILTDVRTLTRTDRHRIRPRSSPW
ncbi:type IV toxin-antitoxin system AbiEi family antitoxin domain-containing protein [Gordonia soli]|uniref:DUF559 domain-containing protein n=1 Tax=Gordonia soli NBRC 108243 TaxID=1223545 RepID=M0QDK3_9ACTN|nr:type IV toxin-antitoxin system AbiEi family antitoxin domain-containing protein [Gordonia soli]GAC66386.1 hypothetical protein GS4_02_00970 [Gordonia soli NBRC 108243]